MPPSNHSHKPRRKRKISDTSATNPSHGTVFLDPITKEQTPAFPLAGLLWPARATVSFWVTLPLVLMAVGIFRWATGLWGYSGFQSPPMYGDFEAQRHWMEVTTYVPISHWYFYDLQWWGLDYPPLTAYHSWILGEIGHLMNADWFRLDSSRGMEDHLLKVYMRATVLVSEYLIYVPALIIFLRRYSRLSGVNGWEALIALVAILMQPSTMLIDHAHFQYNTVMLGLLLASMSSMVAKRPIWAAVFFVLSLGFKQMALFYAPAVFAYLLGICIFPRVNVVRFLGIAFFTVLSFLVLFLPLVVGAMYDAHRGIDVAHLPHPPLFDRIMSLLPIEIWDWEVHPVFAPLMVVTQSIHRIFPFARGLFEDKVANIWCFIHTFHKLHDYPLHYLQQAALLATTATILAPCAVIFAFPKRELLPWAFAATAWGFFLCSFQVHEKNVLLPLLPMTVLLAGEGGLTRERRAWIGWANMIAAWTMFPLLKRDQLRMPYFILTGLWAYLIGTPPASFGTYFGQGPDGPNTFTTFLHLVYYFAMAFWHVCEALLKPPENKPDLWVVVNVLIGASGFGICYLWCLWGLVSRAGLVGEKKPADASEDEKVKKLQ